MIDGFYSIAFTGNAGSGFGVLVIHAGVIVGADASGASYDGKIAQKNSALVGVNVVLNYPAGVTPVQTGIPLTSPASVPIIADLPMDLGSGNPVLLQTPIGPVNIIFKKIRDYPG